MILLNKRIVMAPGILIFSFAGLAVAADSVHIDTGIIAWIVTSTTLSKEEIALIKEHYVQLDDRLSNVLKK